MSREWSLTCTIASERKKQKGFFLPSLPARLCDNGPGVDFCLPFTSFFPAPSFMLLLSVKSDRVSYLLHHHYQRKDSEKIMLPMVVAVEGIWWDEKWVGWRFLVEKKRQNNIAFALYCYYSCCNVITVRRRRKKWWMFVFGTEYASYFFLIFSPFCQLKNSLKH